MSLDKRVEMVRIILELSNGVIFVQNDTIVTEDGKELSRTIHRNSYIPTNEPEIENELVRKVALLYWTPDVVKRYQDIQNKAFESILGVRDAE